MPIATVEVVVLWFCLAREPRGERASRSAEGESLDVSEATYKIKRERSHGVVSSSSGREGRDDQPTELLRGSAARFGRTWTIEKFRN